MICLPLIKNTVPRYAGIKTIILNIVAGPTRYQRYLSEYKLCQKSPMNIRINLIFKHKLNEENSAAFVNKNLLP